MPAFMLSRERAIEIIAEIEKALQEGYAPPGGIDIGSTVQKSAYRVVAERVDVPQQTLRGWFGEPPGGLSGSAKRRYGLQVDWSKYVPRKDPPRTEYVRPRKPSEVRAAQEAEEAARALGAQQAQLEAGPPPSEPEADPVIVRRLRDELNTLRRVNKDLERRVLAAEDIRSGVLGLSMELPPQPEHYQRREGSPQNAETIVLYLSDLQWGEKVSLGEMDGLNSYDLDIARRRLAKWAKVVVALATEHWAGPPPERIILILGGDMVSGAIHYELAKTDELAPIPSARDCADHLYHAITYIKEHVPCPMDVISICGNHGRTTVKPESKNAAATSIDVLVSDFVELALKSVPGITFYAPQSPDALFSVYGWRVLATHGDRIGSRGGQGFIGPAATAARGFKRIVQEYSARGIHLDLILIGHFHTPLELEEGFVNGSLPGPSEYSRDGRFRPHPAVQLFFSVHPRRRCSLRRWIEVGDPSEGSLYEAPPPDRPLRPRFRVKAVTERVSYDESNQAETENDTNAP